MADEEKLSEQDLEKILNDLGEKDDNLGDGDTPPSPATDDMPVEGATDQSGMGLDQGSLDSLMGSLDQEPRQAVESESQILDELEAQGEALGQKDPSSTSQKGEEPLDLSALSSLENKGTEKFDNIELLKDITLRFTVELGHTTMLIRDVLNLSEGSLVELDREDGEDVDILVNNRLFARGRLKLVGECYAVLITRIEDTMAQYRQVVSSSN